VYKTLLALLEITDKVFEEKLGEFTESAMADERTVPFAKYFR